ncbi:acetoacetate-CoA ligase [Ramicandelaber brevisporus]|nr:acetoacetate-CoA ligase [Ramicandelaber brevisporus]
MMTSSIAVPAASEAAAAVSAGSAPLLWQPKDVQSSTMYKFAQFVQQRLGDSCPFATELAATATTSSLSDEPSTASVLALYNALHKWSITDIEGFWAAVWDHLGVIASQPYERVLESGKTMDQLPKWFEGARLNYAENILSRYRDDASTAMLATREPIGKNEFDIETISYAELYKRVEKFAGALRAAGVGTGDRVCAYIPNCWQAIVAFLAASSLGAIWSSTSPDFGVVGVLDRLSQIQPKVLISCNAIVYNGKVHDHMAKLRQVVDGLESSLEAVVVIPFVTEHATDLSTVNHKRVQSWDDFANSSAGQPLEFAQLPFDHPLYILFSSGTTGKPKCLVHGAGGMLLQHYKEHVIHGSTTRDDVILQYTTTGWMMWNWLVGGLSTGASIVVYDGSPFKPTPGVLFDLIDTANVTLFGTSAKFIQSLEDAQYLPAQHHSLSRLRGVYSTGSPLKPESFDFAYQHIKSDIMLGSITGGTDICSLFAGHNAMLPVYRGEIQCRTLGMAIESWDESTQQPIYDRSGDLLCVKPFPCQPVFFWGDSDNAKYRAAYFDNYAGVWYHGDFVIVSSTTGGVVMLGRSDGTLNPGGVRFGSAEIYNVIDTFPQIADSLVVGQKMGEDERVVLFIKLADESLESIPSELLASVKTTIRSKLSPRHVPSVILPIKDIPYTINGKKVEVAVKRILSGQKVIPSGTLANPDSLNQFYDIPALKI